MIKLELELTEIDYDALIRTYLPQVRDKLPAGDPLSGLLGSGGMGETLLLRAPASMKEKMAVELINRNAPTLERQLEDLARRSGIPGKISGLRATSKEKA